jgi:hypothetical protein
MREVILETPATPQKKKEKGKREAFKVSGKKVSGDPAIFISYARNPQAFKPGDE